MVEGKGFEDDRLWRALTRYDLVSTFRRDCASRLSVAVNKR